MKKRLVIFCMLTLLVALFAGCKKNETLKVTTEAAKQTAESTEEKTEEKKEENTEKAAYEVSVKSSNGWQSDNKEFAQFDGVIKNNTGETGKDWTVVVTVPDDASLDQSWNGDFKVEGGKLTIKPVDYNTEIQGNGEVTFGFILATGEKFTPESVVLSLGGKDYAMGDSSASDSKASDNKDDKDKEEANTEAKEIAKKDTKGTPVGNHGQLSVKGTDIVDKDGKIFEIRGVSTHGINWFPDYVNKDAFESLASYGVNTIRLAMYTADYNGYCAGGNQSDLKGLVDKGVAAATDLGMYVIIDWHILNDCDPNTNKAEAKKFFEEMSEKYDGNNNVIYEICNEPNGSTTWDQVKSYAEEIVPVIRANDKDAIIIVGTPTWSQDVDIASENPVKGDNLAYAVHFYAATHKDNIRSKVEKARKNGICVIVSECSICDASGNGNIDYGEADNWKKLVKDNHMGIITWNLSNKDETSSILKPSVTKTSGFTDDDFSEAGKWFMEWYSE